MKELINETAIEAADSLTQQVFRESALLFDIETTGFSAKTCRVYLIGCAWRCRETVTFHQYFAETEQEEGALLTAFFTLCRRFPSTITFNGLGFDIPFLVERSRMLNIPEPLSDMEHLDIFRQISPLKKVLKLPNLKQKSLEQFLALERKDQYSGGELIPVYQEYLKAPEEEKLSLLLTHNREDVLGMADIFPILAYCEFFNGNFEITSMEIRPYQEYEGDTSSELIFTLTPASPLPRRFSCGKDSLYLSGHKDKVRLRVRLYQGELKYFYSNYKDYYYLPQEDMAVHKSVAFYVDKDFRTKAKAANCYSKKTGRFLPQYGEWFSPYFKPEYHDKISYIEMTEEFCSSGEFQKSYLMGLLEVLKRAS